ncbi:hypothetical protein GUJ93_ZPchr0011g27232 [Zizania palustris]|uniref:Uncharacterized protein n=1 Tax=Zizania palustris TaxID=103762 RepID=A0A8J5WE41_ZIZPA|nr:hypothetical protein GUJ93_ZPchr0011g27232 [Zizania palustris]
MESRVQEALVVSADECALVDALSAAARPPPSGHGEGQTPHAASFFEGFVLKGIRVDSVQPGALDCSFAVPPRLTVSRRRSDPLRRPPLHLINRPDKSRSA